MVVSIILPKHKYRHGKYYENRIAVGTIKM
jgi:hypothetical protein